MSTNQLRSIIVAGIFAVPFIALIVAKSLFFPFITGKGFVFRAIVEVIFGLWVILAVRDKEYRPKFTWLSGAVLLFLLVMAMADSFSPNAFKSFWSNYERMEGWIGLLHFAAYYIVAASVLKAQSTWNKLLGTSVFASVIMAIYAFFQLAGKIAINQGGVRVDGTFGNASYLAIYCVFHVFFAALLYLKTERVWKKALLAVAALLNIIVLYFTATRGAILGLLGGVLITAIYLAIKSEKGSKIRKFAWGGLLLVVLVVGSFFAIKNTQFAQKSPVLGRFTTLSLSEIKTQGRYFVWPIAWKGFLEKPVLGWGQESFNFVFNKYYDPRMYNQEPWFDRTHDIVLDWLIAGGLLGLLSYLSIYVALLYYVFKSGQDFLKREDKAVILGLVAAYFFHNIFVFDQIGSYILFFTLIAYIDSRVPRAEFKLWNRIASPFSKMSDRQSYRPIIEAGAAILILVSLYVVVWVPWQQNKTLLNVLAMNAGGKLGKPADYLKPLQSWTMGYSEALEHVSQTAISLASNQQVPEETKTELFKGVNAAFQKFINKVPSDARYRLFYGMFLTNFNQVADGTAQLQKAVELSPRKQSILLQLSNNLLIEGKTAEAVDVAKQAYELEPSYDEAKTFYGLLLMVKGDPEGQKILSTLPEEKLIFDDRYMNVLQQLGRYDQVIAVAKRRTELNSVNPQYKLNLAAAYLLAGRRLDAVGVLEQMIKDDPSFKEQGQYYIDQIRAGKNP